MSQLFTIGFTGKSAETFFSLLRGSRVRRLIDVRLNNVSQLAGFSKRDDLRFFLRELCGADYLHLPALAPTKPLLRAYRGGEMGWEEYSARFIQLLACRGVESELDPDVLKSGCLLCSEHQPDFCHRRLVAEYFGSCMGRGFQIVHLV
jgi:uncharacterized protein (DUF488 family)